MQLQINADASIIRAQIVSVTPKDLRPELEINQGLISIKPLLLNPGDTITLSVLTSGAPPRFEARARVVGVPSVPFLEESQSKTPFSLLVIKAFEILIIFTVAALHMNFEPSRNIGVNLSGRAALFSAIVCSTAGITLLVELMFGLGITAIWQALLAATALIISARVLGNFVNGGPPKSAALPSNPPESAA